VIQDNIRLLMRHLPEGFEEASRETGAVTRTGKVIKNPSDLMWLMLSHLSHGLTLTNTSALALASGLGTLSAVALMRRLANCGGWFKWALGRMASPGVAKHRPPEGFGDYRMLAVDASRVCSGVSKFSKPLNLHFALDIFAMASHACRITGEKTGETLANFTAAKGDLFVGDRIYASKRGMAHCLAGGADFILRLRSGAFAMLADDGARLDLPGLLAAEAEGETADIPVTVDLSRHGMGMRRLRVCAVRKSGRDIEETRRRIDRKDSRRQEETSAEAKKFNEYIVLVTSLPEGIGADKVLAAYRYRWQVELYFKRFKSLLGAGEIPKKRADCMEAWLNGKLMLAVLLEVLHAKLDSPPLGRGGGGGAQHMEGTVFHSAGRQEQPCLPGGRDGRL
jgi:Transposase DDE domain.